MSTPLQTAIDDATGHLASAASALDAVNCNTLDLTDQDRLYAAWLAVKRARDTLQAEAEKQRGAFT